MTIGSRILLVRELLHLNQTELGATLHMGAAAISKYETGRNEPDLSNLDILANALNVSVEWLAYGKLKKNVCIKIKSTRMAYSPTKKVNAFAEIFGVTYQFIDAIENAEVMPSDAFVERIAKQFSLNKYEILFGINPHIAPTKTSGSDTVDYEAATISELTPRQKEILTMLKDDTNAEPLIYDMLKGRKSAEELKPKP